LLQVKRRARGIGSEGRTAAAIALLFIDDDLEPLIGQVDPGDQTGEENREYRDSDEFGGWSLFQELLVVLGEIGAKHSAPIASVATRWVLEQEAVAAVMIGTRSDSHLDDTRQVFSYRLDDQDRSRISSILERAKGPLGEPFELEREPDGPHAKIMWTNLNSQRTP